MEDDYPIGLYLGSTFSCIGVYRNGGIEIVPNSIGDKITPSAVLIKDDCLNQIFVGEYATEHLDQFPDISIRQVKRLIGINKDVPDYKYILENIPFKLVEGKGNNCPYNIEVNVKGKKNIYSPVEITSFIIKRLVCNAENYLNKGIKKIVMAVPAYFREEQKKMFIHSAVLSGLDKINIINEPTAAVLAYGLDKQPNKNILVFKLGGATYEISILSYVGQEINILSTSVDYSLGGEDFDKALADYIINGEYNRDELRNSRKIKNEIKLASENVKKILSVSEETILRLFLDKNTFINKRITRHDFEEICEPLFKRLRNPINEALL